MLFEIDNVRIKRGYIISVFIKLKYSILELELIDDWYLFSNKIRYDKKKNWCLFLNKMRYNQEKILFIFIFFNKI